MKVKVALCKCFNLYEHTLYTAGDHFDRLYCKLDRYMLISKIINKTND